MQAVRFARAGNMKAARQWLDWGRQATNRPNVSDAEFDQVLDSVAAQELIREGKAQEAAVSLERAHQQNPSDRTTTYVLADSLIRSNQAPEAAALIDQLSSGAPNSLAVLRLRAHLLAHQQHYSEAAALGKQICANSNATASDWNDLAWTTLFTGENASAALNAAEKAVQLTNGRNAAILHTFGLAQASNGRLKDAIATGYKLDDISGDVNELQTIFGRVAEEVGLTGAAKAHYSAVLPEKDTTISNYSFAQLRLAKLNTNIKPISKPAE
jgi:predicted Zn-dependent protease